MKNNVENYSAHQSSEEILTLRDSCSPAFINNYDVRWIHYMHSYGRNNTAQTVLTNTQKILALFIIITIYYFIRDDFYKSTITLFHILDILFIYKVTKLFFVWINSLKVFCHGRKN